MKVLVVKLTSMGDVLHLMPALSDLQKANPKASVDWMVEDSFSEIPKWHPSVGRVIKVSTRRWRSLSRKNISEFRCFLKELRAQRYDVVIDAQGLMKSAGFARFAKLRKGGFRAGFSGQSIKESPAARLYHRKVDVPREQHAIDRLRQLFAGVFGYSLVDELLDYSLVLPPKSAACDIQSDESGQRTIMLFHGTTWATKHLPDQLWRDIAALACDDGYCIKLAWGSEAERQRANWIAEIHSDITVLERSGLTDLAQTISSIDGAIAVDTGLGHMAAALGVPCVSIYGSTNSLLTGAKGENQTLLQSQYSCSPCMLKSCPKLSETVSEPPCYSASELNSELSPEAIWRRLRSQIS